MWLVVLALSMALANPDVETLDARTTLQEASPLVLDRQEHDFGTLSEDTTAVLTYTNDSRASVTLTLVTAPNGVRVRLPTEPVGPGASVEVQVSLIADAERTVDGDVIIGASERRGVIRIKGSVLPKPTSGAPVREVGPIN